MSTIHAIDCLAQPLAETPAAIALFGNEIFLQNEVKRHLIDCLTDKDEDQSFGATTLDGPETEWCDVADLLRTVSLFGGDRQVVVISAADEFVKKYRRQLEDYVAKPSRHGCLILQVGTWPGNTKLYKAINKNELQVECSIPQIKRGRSSSRDSKKFNTWVNDWSQTQYQIQLEPAAINLLLDLVDEDLGRMDQELSKLSLFFEPGAKVKPDKVQEFVGGWRNQSIWKVVDAAASGNADEAIMLLNRLIQSGEHPLALYGQLSWSLRRFGRAMENITRCERAGQKLNLDAALLDAGFQQWGSGLDLAKKQLKQLGRKRVGLMYRWLAETDLALKGTHSEPHRGQLPLEKLVARMASELSPSATR